jgi:hypothetical protein
MTIFGRFLDKLQVDRLVRQEIDIDMAAKRHKRHKNKISERVISMGYNE